MKKWDENKIQNNDSPKRVDIINCTGLCHMLIQYILYGRHEIT